MSSKVKKLLKGDNACFIVGIIFIVLILLCGYWAYSISKIDKNNPKYLYDISSSDEYVYINGNDYPLKFASDDTYYYAFVPYFFEKDGKSYYDAYIAAFEKTKYNQIHDLYDKADDNDSIITDGVSYSGVSKFIPTDVRKIALESYPEIFEEDITESEFDDFFGNYYVLVDANPNDYSSPIIVAIMLFIFGGYFMYRGFKSKIKTKKVINSDLYIRAMEEIESPEWETKKAYLTKNYLVFADCGLNIIPYTDITWIYPHTFRYNGIPNHSVAYYIRGSKKMHLISYGLNEKTVNEVVLYISDKNKDALVGYTPENQKQFKEMV